MRFVRVCLAFIAVTFLSGALLQPVLAQTSPPAPTLAAPGNGAAVVQPVTLDWNAVVDPDGPIGSYTWQVSTTSTFSTIALAGFTNLLGPDLPVVTQDKVSGLENGTYFWRVKASQSVGGAMGSIDSPWSSTRTFTVTGLGPAPAAPVISTPASGSRFHVREFFDIKWAPVPNAQYYLVEVDDEPSFSYPLTLTTSPITFGTRFQAGWGNAISNVYYRVRAVSADNVQSRPSSTVSISITNAAPVPSAPSLVSPAAGATVTIPFTFDWTDTANPQIPGYDLDVDTDPSFSGSFGVLLLQGLARSDYMVASDLPPGNYFWRVRALHGDAFGPWTPGRSIKVVAGPPPTEPGLFAIIAEPSTTYGGNSTQARVLLNAPAPAGGKVVSVASDLPQAQVTSPTVFIAAGKTDGTVTPIATGPVPPKGIVGTLRAAYGGQWGQSSLGVLSILYGTAFTEQTAVGGAPLTGLVTLQSAAPPGGTTVRLVSSDTMLLQVPPTVLIPAGAMDATFTANTNAVSEPARIVIESGTDVDGYRAPQTAVMLAPVGSPPPPPSLSSVAISPQSVAAGTSATATVRLTSPAPTGGAVIQLNGSMEGQVITPQTVTIPAGSTSADFTITAPSVNATHWVLIQARYGFSGGAQARLVEIRPGPPGPTTLLAMNAADNGVFGGNSLRGTVALVTPAPSTGGVVALTTDNPGVIHLPATVVVDAGNSTNSFTIQTSPVTATSFARIDASAGGVTKSWFLSVAPNPNAPPLLQSMSVNPTSVAGGASSTGTVVLSSPAPANGINVTLSTSDPSVARPPPIVFVPAGATNATFGVTTFAVSTSASVSITAQFDSSRTATLTVTSGTPPPAATLSSVILSPTAIVGGNTVQGTVRLTTAAPASGAVVALSSNNTSAATVPASVGIAAGATSATFTVATSTVGTATAVTIAGTYGTVTRNALLTLNPASGTGGGPLAAPPLMSPSSDARFSPGQTIAFDWSDVTGAANYTLQIDDADTFPAPQIVDQSMAQSQFSTSALPTKRMWWRVRANDAAGNPGIWSSVRRFEVKN